MYIISFIFYIQYYVTLTLIIVFLNNNFICTIYLRFIMYSSSDGNFKIKIILYCITY